MPTFSDPEKANEFIAEMLDRGMICEQRFNADGGIDVFCHLNAGEPTSQRTRRIPVKKEFIPLTETLTNEKPEEIKTVEQKTFPGKHTLDLPHELRDYQQEAVRFALAHKHCIIEIPTGRGKSLISLAIVNELVRERPRKTLVIVPTTVLLDQWIKDGFGAAGVEASGVSGESKAWGQYTVITYQSAIRNLDHIPPYEIVVFDEVHHLFSPEYSRILATIMRSGADEKYLIGLTATVREYGDALIMQNRYFPSVFSKSLEEFQSGSGRIPVKIYEKPVHFTSEEMAEYDMYQATIKKANRMFGPVPEWTKYMRSSDESQRRLALAAIRDYSLQKRLLTETPGKIDEIIRIIKNNTGQFIIFSDTIEGIQSIEQALKSHGITEGSIYSGVPATKRRMIIDGLRDGSIRVLVGGNAITEGLDLPDISNVVLTSMLVKSTRTPVQRLGRVLRPKTGKQVKIFLVYVAKTLEEENAQRIYNILGEESRL